MRKVTPHMSSYGYNPSPDSLAILELSGAVPVVSVEDQVVELFTEMHIPVFRHLVWLGLRSDQAEDIVQETFLKLYQHLSRPDSPRHNIRGWVWRVAHNLGLNLCLSSQRMGTRTELNLDEISLRLVDPRPDPEQTLLRSQSDRRIEAGMERLNERDRLCMHLRAQGLGYRQIASILGIGRSTVADTMARVTTFLRSYSHS